MGQPIVQIVKLLIKEHLARAAEIEDIQEEAWAEPGAECNRQIVLSTLRSCLDVALWLYYALCHLQGSEVHP